MLIINRKKKFVSSAAYSANAVHFDGTNDYLTRGADLTGVSDGKSGLISFWINLTGGNATNMAVLINTAALGTGFYIVRTSGNVFQFVGRNTTDTAFYLTMSTSAAYTTASGWVHVLATWDLAATTGQIYVNDASDLAGGGTFTNNTVDYTRGGFAVGAETDGGSKLNADLADFYAYFNQTLDLSTTSNRRKFIDASGKPVDLGSTGQTPLGTNPDIFLKNPTATWHTNVGDGGGFTENGALTDAASSPSA